MTLYSIIDSDDGHILGSYKINARQEEIDKILEATVTVFGVKRTVALFLSALINNDITWKQIDIKGGVF